MVKLKSISLSIPSTLIKSLLTHIFSLSVKCYDKCNLVFVMYLCIILIALHFGFLNDEHDIPHEVNSKSGDFAHMQKHKVMHTKTYKEVI